jgi:hypothetical protein
MARWCLLAILFTLPAWAQSPRLYSHDGKTFLGNLNANRFDPDSIANPFGRYGSPTSPDSIHNRFGRYGNPASPVSATNPYARTAPRIVAPDGTFLGNYSANRFAPDSVSNRFGRYGSPSSPLSIHNRFGRYGNPSSPDSATNRFGRGAPRR